MDSSQRGDFEMVKSMLADDFQCSRFIPRPIDKETWLGLLASFANWMPSLLCYHRSILSISFGCNNIRIVSSRPPVMELMAFSTPVSAPEKAVLQMETRVYVGHLAKSTTQEELNTLFAQAGKVTAVELIKDRKSGESRGFAFVTMSAPNEAEKAISMFDTYSLSDYALKVSLAKPRE
ncbi:MAG TPA: hypothetical protein VHP14_27540 [Anaerolineales bacterium]|nr:hypothetical protein [Anaerolineales bacterium]